VFCYSVFLKELEKYETIPEDIGHCFVTWVRALPRVVIYNCVPDVDVVGFPGFVLVLSNGTCVD